VYLPLACPTLHRRAARPDPASMSAAGEADPQLGAWPDITGSPNVIQTLPLWPTTWADPGYTVRQAGRSDAAPSPLYQHQHCSQACTVA
jgi:hypothetical protein